MTAQLEYFILARYADGVAIAGPFVADVDAREYAAAAGLDRRGTSWDVIPAPLKWSDGDDVRQRHRVDATQKAVVDALRKIGASVRVTSMLGQGFPDLTVGYQGLTFLVEVKDGSLKPSAQRLTPDEQRFVEGWRGSAVMIVGSAAEAVETILQRARVLGGRA